MKQILSFLLMVLGVADIIIGVLNGPLRSSIGASCVGFCFPGAAASLGPTMDIIFGMSCVVFASFARRKNV